MRAVYETLEAAPLVERAHEVVEKGYRAFKAVFIPYTHYHAPLSRGGQGGAHDGGIARCGRPRYRGDGRFPRPAGQRLGGLAYIQALEPGRPMFVEEPVPPGETGALQAIASRTGVPLATGERLIDRAEFHDLLGRAGGRASSSRISVIVAGFSRRRRSPPWRRLSRLASRRTIRLGRLRASPRCILRCRRPIMSSRRKWLARSPGISMWCRGRSAWSMVSGKCRMRPGLGIEVNEAECARSIRSSRR